MVKLDYFKTLEELSDMTCGLVRLACKDHNTVKSYAVLEAMERMDKSICSLEKALACDFIPPLQREDIASYAHALSRVCEAALECYKEKRAVLAFCQSGMKNEEGRVCLCLCELLSKETRKLKSLRRSSALPDSEEARRLIGEGREAHTRALSRAGTGSFPRAYLRVIVSTGSLRRELSDCYDKLIEVILNNL